MAAALTRFGHQEESREMAERAYDWYQLRDPVEYRRQSAEALLLANRPQEALDLLRPLVGEYPDSLEYRGLRGIALALTGDADGSSAEVGWLEALEVPYLFGADTYWRAAILAHLGRKDEAVRLLRQAYREGRDLRERSTDPNLMPLWGHEQFEQFVAPRG